MAGRGLHKRDVEDLLAHVDDDVDGLQAALAAALAIALGRDPAEGFAALAAAAAPVGGWAAERVERLVAGERGALWDLVAELNEVRGLTPQQGRSGGRHQREAVSAVERAVRATLDGDAPAVRRAAAAIAELDVKGSYGRLPSALEAAAAAIGAGAPPDLGAVRDALPPGPLRALLEG